MKTILMLALAAVMIPAAALAQDTMKPSPDQMKSGSTKATHVMGKISDDGKSFVSDQDGKTWTIDNPDAVKGHEGHHVDLKAQVDAGASSVHVMSLKMAKDTMSKDKM